MSYEIAIAVYISVSKIYKLLKVWKNMRELYDRKLLLKLLKVLKLLKIKFKYCDRFTNQFWFLF